MKVVKNQDSIAAVQHLEQARTSLVEILKTWVTDISILEEAAVLKTVNALRDIQNSIRLGEE